MAPDMERMGDPYALGSIHFLRFHVTWLAIRAEEVIYLQQWVS